MGNIFARLLEEGTRQQEQLQEVARASAEPQAEGVEVFKSDSTTARQQAVQKAERHDSKLSRQHDSTQEYVSTFLQAKATNKTTLRYPQSLMSEIDDVIYQIRKTYGVSLSKNEVFILALASILQDFKRNASRSLIYTELVKHKEK